jgi:hypothetical protein
LHPGLLINASNCTVRGLVINRFPGDGIFFSSPSGSTPTIRSKVILSAPNPAGTGPWKTTNGIGINFSTANLIGGTTPAARNVISGKRIARNFSSDRASGTTIQGNFIGTTASGTAALGNNSGVSPPRKTARTLSAAPLPCARNVYFSESE